MRKFIDSAKRKAVQPSTWAGLGLLGMIFGVKELQAFSAPDIAASVAALAAIFLNEKPSP